MALFGPEVDKHGSLINIRKWTKRVQNAPKLTILFTFTKNNYFCATGAVLLNEHRNNSCARTLTRKNKTIGDGGITIDFWIINVHTSN